MKAFHLESGMTTTSPLPSAGTEADTVRRFAELASQRHHALTIHAPSAAQTEHVMELLKDFPISYGQKRSTGTW